MTDIDQFYESHLDVVRGLSNEEVSRKNVDKS